MANVTGVLLWTTMVQVSSAIMSIAAVTVMNRVTGSANALVLTGGVFVLVGAGGFEVTC